MIRKSNGVAIIWIASIRAVIIVVAVVAVIRIIVVVSNNNGGSRRRIAMAITPTRMTAVMWS